MKRLILAVATITAFGAHAQEAPQQQPAPQDPRLVATEAMLNQEMAAHRDALAKVVELDRMVSGLQARLSETTTQLKSMKQSGTAPTGGDPPK